MDTNSDLKTLNDRNAALLNFDGEQSQSNK